MNEEDLIKLAEIAGIKKVEGRENYMFEYWTDGKVQYMGWQPDKDLNQAFLCLEMTGYKWTLQSVEDSMDKIVYIYAKKITQGYAATLSEAICKAVLEVKS